MSEAALNFITNTRKYKLVAGSSEISQFVTSLAKKSSCKKKCCLVALDGFIGVDWQEIIQELKKTLRRENLRVKDIDIASCYKSSVEIQEMTKPFLTDDPVFGIIFKGKLEEFFDQDKLKELRRALKALKEEELIICFGYGAANKWLLGLYDFIFYVDVTREEVGRRNKKNLVSPIGYQPKPKKNLQDQNRLQDSTPIYLSTKRFYYIDYPVLDVYKKRLLPRIDYYIDGNIAGEPKLISRRDLSEIFSALVQHPFRLKPYYDPSPWGGQWLKKIRRLNESMPNCAWSYEIIAPEMSLKIAVGDNYLEIPFSILLWQKSYEIMGEEAVERFHDNFPIRVNYDESIEGDNMAIQVHPNTAYIKKHFNEQMGQDESYYIVATGSDSKVYLGLKEDADKDEFYEMVRRAETKGVPFEHDKYVNSIPSEAGDLFLIPAGTVHASGRNEVVLEISATTYRYTFHLYDYLRLDLDGKLRPIHSHHAFQALKSSRRSRWVAKNLKQKPRLVKSGEGWAEYLLGKRKDLFFVVYRLEFAKAIEEETKDKFHILNLVDGDSVLVRSQCYPERKFELDFSETVVIPASIGRYSITNLGDRPCRVLKILLK